MPQANEKKIRIPRGFGDVEVRANTVNEEDRSVEVVWSTGAAVKRYSWDEGYYMEELSMEPKAIRMDRFKSGMSLLDSHDNYSMAARLGTVIPGSVRVEGGKGYARVKFSRSQMAETIFRDLLDGHPVQISVGYKIHRYEKIEGSQKTLPTLRATDWEPMELSAVPIPADAGAFSRSDGPASGETYEEVILHRMAEEETAADAASIKEIPMNKREAAKTLKGKELEVLALGSGLARNANETDEQLSARLLAHFDAEDKQRAEAEAAQQRAAEAAALIERSVAPLQNVDVQSVGPTAAELTEKIRKAQEDERKRANEIRALARTAGFREEEDFVRSAIDTGATVEAFRGAVLEALIKRQEQSPTFPIVETRGLQDSRDTFRRLAVNGMLHRHNVTQKLEDGANTFRAMTPVDLARECLMVAGENTRGLGSIDIVRRALHTASDFPLLLGEITRETLLSGYMAYENTFQLIANRNVLPDLRDVKVLEVGEAPSLLEVTETGEYKSGTIKESKESWSIGHYGRKLGLSEKMLINDQLGAFSQVLAGWGRQVARLEGDLVWAIILQNKKLVVENKELFHADHKNLGTAAALSQASLEAARKMWRTKTDLDGNLIGLSPRLLFTGSEYETVAEQLINGVTTPQTPDQVVPRNVKSLQPVYEYRIDTLSTKTWFLFANPGDLMGRGLQYGYLAGYETPRTLDRWGFDVDGYEVRIDHYFGAGLTDHRFAYKNAGPA